jgi:NAD(P)H dehydrogenase (quinone)
MVIGGVPYSQSGLAHMGDITGGTPYGTTTLAGPDGSRQLSENELKIARYQGKHAAELATKLFR